MTRPFTFVVVCVAPLFEQRRDFDRSRKGAGALICKDLGHQNGPLTSQIGVFKTEKILGHQQIQEAIRLIYGSVNSYLGSKSETNCFFFIGYILVGTRL